MSALLSALLFALPAFAKPDDDLIVACKKGDLAAVDAALAAGASPDATDKDGNAALEKAIFWPEIVKRLLEKGAKPDGGKYPALLTASTVYASETMKLLLDAGANPNQVGKLGPMTVTPLRQVVAQTNCVPCLTVLLEKGADPLAVKDGGGNLLHVFASYGQTKESRKQLFAKSADVLEKRFKLKVPDWYRDVDKAGNGTPAEMLAPLLGKGLDMEARNPMGNTPLLEVLAGGVGNKEEIGIALVNAGADGTAEHAMFGKAILIATRTKMAKLVEAMIQKGADPNAEGKGYDDNAKQFINGFTPLIVATMQNDAPMVDMLLKNGAKATGGLHGFSWSAATGCAQQVKGKGAIYFAIENGNAELVEKLSAVGPWSKLEIDQLKQKGSSTMSMGGGWSMTTSWEHCTSDGSYTPSEYAADAKSPLTKMLVAKGL